MTASGAHDLESPCIVMRAFGDSRLYLALKSFHSHPRNVSQYPFIDALKLFSKERSVENRALLDEWIANLALDETEAGDRELKSALQQILTCASEAGSLTNAIEKLHSKSWSEADLRKLILRFERVCDGVAYAHSKGVVHLDLKPDNIILGEFGETLVADWGLATEVDSIDQAQGDAQGTLIYMSPEQAKGDLACLGTASDIYSLGAVLYFVLTGQDAIIAQPKNDSEKLRIAKSDIFDRVVRGDFLSPKLINPKVPKPLEKIVLKAMSHLPSDRYVTVVEMAKDVRRWLNGEPVAAWREPLQIKAMRFVKEHSGFVLATIAAFAGYLGVLGIIELVDYERGQANIARRTAEAKSQIAFEQSQLAFSILETVLVDLQISLKNVAGGADVRNKLLTAALPQLERLEAQYIEGAEINRINMSGMIELGDTLVLLGRSAHDQLSAIETLNHPQINLDGNPSDFMAHRVYQRALDFARVLYSAKPDSLESQRDLWRALSGMGRVSQYMGKSEIAVRYHREALKVIQSAVRNEPHNEPLQFELSKSLENLGNTEWRLGKLQTALEYMQMARAVAHQIAKKNSENPTHKLSLASLNEQLSFLLTRAGDSQAALELLEESVRIRETTIDSQIANAEMQRGLSISLIRIGELLTVMDSTDAAIERIRKGVNLSRLIASQDPSNQQKQLDLVKSLEKYGDILQQCDRSKDALEIYQECLQISERVAESTPFDADAQRNLAIAFERIGMMLVKLGRSAESEKSFTRTLEILQELQSRDRNSRLYQADVANAHVNLGSAFLALGANEEAMDNFQASLTMIREVVKHDTSANSMLILSIALERIGDMLLSGYQAQESLAYLQESVEVRRRLAGDDLRNMRAQLDLSNSLSNLGDALLQLQKQGEALETYQESLAISRKLTAADGKNQHLQRNLASSLSRVADGLSATGKPGSALEHSKSALAILRSLAEADQTDIEKQSDVGCAFSRFGDFLVQNGRTSEAIESIREGLKYSTFVSTVDPSNADRQHNLMYSYFKLGETLLSDCQYEQAKQQFLLAEGILDRMIGNGQSVESSIAERRLVETRVKVCSQAQLATADVASLFIQDEKEVPGLLLLRLQHFQKLRHVSEIAVVAEILRNLVPHHVDNVYNAACAYAICFSLASNDGAETTDVERNRYAGLAIECLNEAIALGFNSYELIKQDTDLAPLAKLPEFLETISGR